MRDAGCEMRSVSEAYICAALRTPVGKHGGALASVRADDLAAIPIKALVERTGIEPAAMDDSTVGWRFTNPRLKPDWTIPLGETAEVVATRYGITRAEQDAFAVESQRRAERAQEECVFTDELVPVTLPDGTTFAKDEYPRPGTTLEGVAKLKPAFRSDGSV